MNNLQRTRSSGLSNANGKLSESLIKKDYGKSPTKTSTSWACCQDFEKSEDWERSDDVGNTIEGLSLKTPQKGTKSVITECPCKTGGALSYRLAAIDRGTPSEDYTLSGTVVENKEDSTESLLLFVRNHLANYQESYGIPRAEYTFIDLVKVTGQTMGRSLLALFYMFITIAPLTQVFIHALRFVLDKLINIKNTKDTGQVIIKYAILAVQLLSICVSLIFIFDIIIQPSVYMMLHIIAKMMGYN